jgi:putative transposase
MARLPRIVIPGQALHIIQRGNNRQPCFFADDDYRYYLDSLKDAAARYGGQVHAYVLMTNHVHLLLTPEFAETPSMVLQSVGRRYVRYVNQVYRRSGTLWEGRYKSTLIDSDRYLLTCSRYIELNPVRARMVDHPGDYRWSSYICNASGETGSFISPHPLYLAMGNAPPVRALAYRALFDRHIDSHDLLAIREATETGAVLGNDRFKGQVEEILRCRVNRQPHGGDRKSEKFQEGRKGSVER